MNEAKQPLGKWSDEEDKRLLAMYEDGEPIVKIAAELHRTPDSIRNRAYRLRNPQPETDSIEIAEPVYGACKYCNQICADADDLTMTREERDEEATMHCKCPQARKHQRMKREIDSSIRRINLLFGASAGEYGFGQVSSEIIDLLSAAARLVGNEKIRSAAFSVDYADTAKISVTSKGTIKVERAKNVKCQLEQETPE